MSAHFVLLNYAQKKRAAKRVTSMPTTSIGRAFTRAGHWITITYTLFANALFPHPGSALCSLTLAAEPEWREWHAKAKWPECKCHPFKREHVDRVTISNIIICSSSHRRTAANAIRFHQKWHFWLQMFEAIIICFKLSTKYLWLLSLSPAAFYFFSLFTFSNADRGRPSRR